MPVYPRETVVEVLTANDIVDVVGARVQLKSAGAGRLKGLCPFHNEKTPSFTVSRARQAYHCFGCGKGGDAIAFVMEQDGLNFVEALRHLADRAGMRLPAATPSDDRREYLRTQLLELNKAAASFYQRTYAHEDKGKAGRDYVARRQLNQNTVERFGLGYAPEGWESLVSAARQRKTSDAVLEASGLAKRGERGNLYDFFRHRVIFPIKDVAGRIVAFGGRDLGDSPAKYLNSPETPLYKKSRILYGLHESRDALRKEGHAVVVEGYFDLLRCFDAGIENVVATCGTALTAEQALLIRRYAPEVVLLYDGDAAGIQAALKGCAVLAGAGLQVRATALPEGQDPDDFVLSEGADAMRIRLKEAKDFIHFYADMNTARLDSPQGPSEVAHELFAIFEALDDRLLVDEYLKRAAEALRLQEWSCRREFERFLNRKARRRISGEASEEPSPGVKVHKDDLDFVTTLANDAALRAQAREALDGVDFGGGALHDVLAHLLAGPEDTVFYSEDETARTLYAAASNSASTEGAGGAVLVEKQIRRLKKNAFRRRADALQQTIQEAERGQDMPRMTQLLGERVSLMRKIEELGAT